MNLFHIYLVFSPYVKTLLFPPVESRVTLGKTLSLREGVLSYLYQERTQG